MRRFRWELVGALAGAVVGWLYWRFWGCEQGCLIRSNWEVMTPYGAVMGALVASLIKDFFRLRKKEGRTNTSGDARRPDTHS